MPASIEAEEHLISAIFIDPASVLQRCEEARITADSFSDPKHGIVFDCQRATFQRLGYTDVAIVAEELKASRQLDQVNGYAFLVQVSSRSPTTAQASYFVDKVREQATLREIIKTATSAVEDCYNFSGEIDELLDGVERRIASVKAGSSISSKWALRSFADFTTPPDDDANALLGRYRYLCRGGALVISGATGIGKSSIAFQSAVHWALGRDFLGIPCTRPLKSLIIGAEDDEGDIGEVRDSIFAAMKLTAAEVAAVKTRVIVVDERAAVGDDFLRELRRAATSVKKSEEPFDLVAINPLLAFAGCAVSDQAEMGRFLRAGLNRINSEKRWAYIISHHTNKPPAAQDKPRERKWNEFAYEMAGSAEISNWPRAIINVEPLKEDGRFLIRLAKRGRRAGVRRERKPADDFSPAKVEIVTTIYARHARERVQLDAARSIPMIFWLPDSPPDEEESCTPKRPGPAPKFTFADFRPAFVSLGPTQEKPVTFGVLYRSVLGIDGSISKATFAKVLKSAVDEGRVVKCTDKPGYHLP